MPTKGAIVAIIICGLTIPLGYARPADHTTAQSAVSPAWIREHITTNPVTPAWVETHLKKRAPRLILTDSIEERIKHELNNNRLLRTYFDYLHQRADAICRGPLLQNHEVGIRFPTSEIAMQRISVLAFVYRFTRDRKYLDRLAKILDRVSGFPDWGRSNYLDVATMAAAVAIGLDWTGERLPAHTVTKARAALRERLQMSLTGTHGGSMPTTTGIRYVIQAYRLRQSRLPINIPSLQRGSSPERFGISRPSWQIIPQMAPILRVHRTGVTVPHGL